MAESLASVASAPSVGSTVAAAATRRAAELAPRMRAICGAANVLTDPLELRTYECDGLTSHRSTPALVVLPESADQVAAVVRACAEAGVIFVARGSGTGLSGGALPHSEGVLIVMSRMRAVIEIDQVARRAIVEPGVTNLSVTEAVRPFGLFYAPDPSSQVVCSVGGNVAENSGGAHCLKHGFTVNHVLGLEIVTPAGELTWLGDGTGVGSGYDLLGAFTGSEGTLGVVTKIVVKLSPAPEAVHLVLAAYDSLEAGGRAVTDIIGAGIVPAAIEMMDALSIEAAEAAVHCGYPEGAAAVLLVELDGPAAEVEAELATVRALCEQAGAREIRAADDPVQRAGIWAGRKSAFAAVGRLSPPTSSRTGWCPGPRLATSSPGSRRCRPRPASGWRTSSTPVTGTCTPWSSTTTPCPVRRRRRRCSPAPSSTPASPTAVRSRESTVWAWINPDICRKCSAPPTWIRCSWSVAPSTRRPSAIRARSSRPRGCAERSPVTTAVRAQPRPPAWRFSNAMCNARGLLPPARDPGRGHPRADGDCVPFAVYITANATRS